MLARFLVSLGVTLLCSMVHADGPRKGVVTHTHVDSPDRRTKIQLDVGNGGVRYSVERAGHILFEPASIDALIKEHGSIAADATVEQINGTVEDENISLAWGKAKQIRNRYAAKLIRLRSGSMLWELELRAYDDGVAFRYGFPHQLPLDDVVIESEKTEFRLSGDPQVVFSSYDNFTTSHETLQERKSLSEMPTKKLLEMPLQVTWPDGTAAAVTEAKLRGFAGMYLERPDDKVNTLRSRLSPLPGRPSEAVVRPAPFWSPWRVVLLAERAGQLVENNVLLCLNDPPRGDFSWVKPGKTTWHWWNGTVENGAPSSPEVNFAVHKKYIDFCAAHHIAYHSVISVGGGRPWYEQSGDPGYDPRPDTDILTPRPDLGLPRILDYAREKGVGIRLWVYWKPLAERLEPAFAQYERWGIKGLMVDFMDRDDQEMVEWQEKVLQAAARHKLLIQFHGSYKPSGEQRTYPNLVNREGVLNLEYLKWTDQCSPQHDVDVAYTRALAGPLDYHLGGFRAAARDKFQPHDERPEVLGTRCHQLALYVVYENPMPMLSDYPEAYEKQRGFEFFERVPTTWDETRIVAGEPSEFIVVARRSGKDWYIGGITNWTKRDVTLPLGFLGSGRFTVSQYADGPLDASKPNEVHISSRAVTSEHDLEVRMASGGGVAAIFQPTE